MRALEERARRDGFSIEWRHSPEFERSYALIEGASPESLAELFDHATVFESPVIALALRPNVAEALPALQSALGGPGRPAGIVGCERYQHALVIEWDLDTTPASLVLAVIRVELARIHASCVKLLLAPIPLAWWTRIAAEGLGAPEIAPDRVLEALVETYDVAP